ncbi:UTP--GlnB (protein PII) uridylyltransferase, GlnD [Moraxella cuniculi DSM 21768]|uniref:Bifunctional uridylyltransferase/uridylyl-removing enzyme n=1 Tax=Moraxella cuniculi DSM 21768 TaxID=1122245 RepID=A0A1N7FXN0_9GAMM|nr:[protein-PII] uridylyltransferase [Moraxella cuniculi]OOS04409.1 [protein-PII] uridylyltransferase [Moraxella cuniculi]SIS05091.1 UTP--GlnB (protein PII) uridylyltransferase, GlnD [Moraxella cuniculi DSM 21768]
MLDNPLAAIAICPMSMTQYAQLDQSDKLLAYCQQLELNLPTPPNLTDCAAIRHYLQATNHAIDKHLRHRGTAATEQIGTLINIRTLVIDEVLSALFAYHLPDNFALFAIGGYGRCELLPASDIDILLIGENIHATQANIEQFVASLWDIGITPAFSVQDKTALDTAVSDQTIATAWLDARLVAGNVSFINLPFNTVKKNWSIQAFYTAKINEAKQRYLSHNATEYNLEPHIKNAPGGLRDLHILHWLSRFYFGQDSSDAVANFISQDERQEIIAAQEFLWCVRHHLHTLANRNEDRLLFDYQKSLAERFGYYQPNEQATHHDITAALEVMMRQYYHHAMRVTTLSEMLCAYFAENYLTDTSLALCSGERTVIDDNFCLISTKDTDGKLVTKIHANHADTFSNNPANLLKIFLIMGQQGINKITAATLRAINQASLLIDDDFRNQSQHRQLFLANLQQSNYLFHRLRLMKRFGVLGNYLPAFGQVMGLMQYDLFHRYTVDAHTLFLVRILHRFETDSTGKYGLASEIYQKIARKDILIIAAIFHDIAKGRGGDHAKLGAVDAYQFCLDHGMSESDSQLVRWLVLEHLTMSLTAQKQDISDPDVITRFAEFSESIARLNHLYVLTVADMNATNSQLWNSWRATLLKQLYTSVHRVHSLGVHTVDKDKVIALRKTAANDLLIQQHHTQEQITALWSGFGEEYFLKQKVSDIVWQTTQILANKHKLTLGEPIIMLRRHDEVSLRGIQLLVCTPDQDNLFATTVCVLDKMGLSVLDATIISASIDDTAMALDCYVLIDRHGANCDTDLLSYSHRHHELVDKLRTSLHHQHLCTPPKTFKTTSPLRHFNLPTQVHFTKATTLAQQGRHQMQLITKDRPSLLAKIGAVFSELSVQVHGARITTLGERAEDMFYLSNQHGELLSDDKLIQIKEKLINILDN